MARNASLQINRPEARRAGPGDGETLEPSSGIRPSRLKIRRILLYVLPLVAIVGAVAYWLTGGRYVETDNAYVGANRVAVSAETTGKIVSIAVHEGEMVKAGQVLFQIDPETYLIARQNAQAAIDAATVKLGNLKAQYRQGLTNIQSAQAGLDYQVREMSRQQELARTNVTSAAALDKQRNAVATSAGFVAGFRGQVSVTLAGLRGNPDLALDDYPDYQEAKASLAKAQQDLDRTMVRAGIDGMVTQVDQAVAGRFISPGMPVMAIIDINDTWVDANPKETDLTYVKVGQPVEMTVDAYPDYRFHGHVSSLSPGTGAQFSVLPAQNSSGNWVKVVQRIPLRITLDRGKDDPILRAGMSVTTVIDTGHERKLSDLY